MLVTGMLNIVASQNFILISGVGLTTVNSLTTAMLILVHKFLRQRVAQKRLNIYKHKFLM